MALFHHWMVKWTNHLRWLFYTLCTHSEPLGMPQPSPLFPSTQRNLAIPFWPCDCACTLFFFHPVFPLISVLMNTHTMYDSPPKPLSPPACLSSSLIALVECELSHGSMKQKTWVVGFPNPKPLNCKKGCTSASLIQRRWTSAPVAFLWFVCKQRGVHFSWQA